MGKNFRKELDSLSEIYTKASLCDYKIISEFLEKYFKKFFLGIGSGGSFSVAKIFEYMCTVSGIMSKSITPLELEDYSDQLKRNVAVIFTAGGGNNDSKNAYKYVSEFEMEGILTCCMRRNSPIKRIQRENLHNYFFEYQMPTSKDGYLAVESLISALTILSKAFEEVTKNEFFKISENDEWLNGNMDLQLLKKTISKESIIVLHGGITTPAANDLESKFSETSLGNIQLVDFRNFAHGRHFWLSDRTNSTGIVALVSSNEQKLATQTLQIVPKDIPIFRVDVDGKTIMGLFEAFHYVFEIVYQAGIIRGIDPGMPKVPDFGRKMYHINYNFMKKKNVILCAAERKMISGMNECREDIILQGKKFYSRIHNNSFQGIIFDYDGTLHNKEKNTLTEKAIFIKLNELLGKGIKIGIATGRGKSVREELQKVIQKAYWEQVVIAYYNGGCIGTLADDAQPNKKVKEYPKDFDDIVIYMNKSIPKDAITIEGIIEKNPYQLTIIESESRNEANYLALLKDFAQYNLNLKVLESSHSIDIIPRTSSKNNIFAWSGWHGCKEDCFLRIGDSGNIGGNDYELLQSIFGLSVDAVSPDPDSCWNFAKPGMRNLEATLYYLTERIVINENEIKWR